MLWITWIILWILYRLGCDLSQIDCATYFDFFEKMVYMNTYTFVQEYTNYKSIIAKYKPIQPTKPIYIFIHICTDGTKWDTILDEILSYLIQSGLYQLATKICYGCSCFACDIKLKKYIWKYSKLEKIDSAIVPYRKTYENVTINEMIQFCKSSQDIYCLYLHTKGSVLVNNLQDMWRRQMLYWTVINFMTCISLLDRGFNTVGVNLAYYAPSKKGLGFYPNYSGNYWWAQSTYLKTLDLIDDIEYKYNAEIILLQKRVHGKHCSIGNPLYPWLLGKTNCTIDDRIKTVGDIPVIRF